MSDNQQGRQYRNRAIITIVVILTWLFFLPFFSSIFFSKLFYMPFVGAIAATIANITPAAAGIVYFPILTQLSVPPITVTQFSLMIQAYGMGLGTFRWFQLNRGLFIFKLLPICIAWGFLGELVSIVFFPIKSPDMLTLVFNFIAFLFTQIIFFSLLKNTSYANVTVELTPQSAGILSVAALIGGMLCGWIGFGIDTLFYFILTLVFRINPAISIVTSISLMAAMSITGTVLNWIFYDLPLALWFSAIPGVTLAGLFLAAYIAVKIGSKNILLLFTAFLTIDFFMALWTQQVIPMGDTTRGVIIISLAFYMVGMHVKLFSSRPEKTSHKRRAEFHAAMGETEIEEECWGGRKDDKVVGQ